MQILSIQIKVKFLENVCDNVACGNFIMFPLLWVILDVNQRYESSTNLGFGTFMRGKHNNVLTIWVIYIDSCHLPKFFFLKTVHLFSVFFSFFSETPEK